MFRAYELNVVAFIQHMELLRVKWMNLIQACTPFLNQKMEDSFTIRQLEEGPLLEPLDKIIPLVIGCRKEIELLPILDGIGICTDEDGTLRNDSSGTGLTKQWTWRLLGSPPYSGKWKVGVNQHSPPYSVFIAAVQFVFINLGRCPPSDGK